MAPGPDKQFNTDEVLERAMHVFWAHGYEATSLSELTAEMGIGKKSLYDTYGNKRALFLKSLDRYMQLQYERIRGCLLQGMALIGRVAKSDAAFEDAAAAAAVNLLKKP